MRGRSRVCFRISIFALLSSGSYAFADAPFTARFDSTSTLGYFMTGAALAVDTDADGFVDAASQPASVAVSASQIPAGATLVRAFLYWAGSQVESGGPCVAGNDEMVSFQAPSGAVQVVTADASYCSDGGSSAYDMSVSVADVTSLVSGMVGTYTVDGFSGRFSDGSADNGSFAVVLIYELASATTRRVVLFDGIITLSQSSAVLAVTGLVTDAVPGGSLTWYALDGDPGAPGSEGVTAQGSPGGASASLSDAINPAADPMNRTINTSIPASTATTGVDIDRFDLSSVLSPGDSQLEITYSTGADRYWLVSTIVDVTVEPPPTGITESPPLEASLLFQNVPNPFGPVTTIRYEIPASGTVSLRVYSSDGRLVRTLVDGFESPGTRHTKWDGRDDRGHRVATGVYFCRLRGSGFVRTRKMILVK